MTEKELEDHLCTGPKAAECRAVLRAVKARVLAGHATDLHVTIDFYCPWCATAPIEAVIAFGRGEMVARCKGCQNRLPHGLVADPH
jgi:hypothetical protein